MILDALSIDKKMFFKKGLLAQSKDLSSCAFHAIQLGKLSAIFIKTSQDNDNPDIAGIKHFGNWPAFPVF